MTEGPNHYRCESIGQHLPECINRQVRSGVMSVPKPVALVFLASEWDRTRLHPLELRFVLTENAGADFE